MIYLAFRFRNIKLGPEDSEPEFTDMTYFAMLFSAGIGVGLFFFGVSEPLWHQASHWYANAGYHNQDEIDMFALNLSVFHVSLHSTNPRFSLKKASLKHSGSSSLLS